MKIIPLEINPLALMAAITLALIGCQDHPKVIEASVSSGGGQNTGIFTDKASNQKDDIVVSDNLALWHKVKVEKVLPASRYIYLYVSEGGKKYWLATNKMAINVGDSFKYKGGLLKTNFESKEHGRTFDRLYLVSDVVPVKKLGQSKPVLSRDIRKVSGTITIAELVDNKEKYANQTVKVSGICSKINPNIMGRHWIHLKDGTMDDYDLVVTSQSAIPQGHPVAMEAKVVLNRDFGSGYSYDILLEEGRSISQE